MDVLELIKQSQMWLIPLSCLVFTQIIKIFIRLGKGQKVNWRMFFSYGSMPSSHAALFVSLVTIIFLIDGYDTAAFAVAVVVMIIFIRDAVGVRRAINLGHTPYEVLVGSIVGVVYTSLLYGLFLYI